METTLDLLDLPVAASGTTRTQCPIPRHANHSTPGLPNRVTPARPHDLPPMALLSVRGLAGSRVLVDVGRLWITESNDVADHFIGAGEVYRIRGAGVVVLQCDSAGGARFRLEDRHGNARVVSGF